MSANDKTRPPGDESLINKIDGNYSITAGDSEKEVIVSVKIKKELLGNVVSSLSEISSSIEVNHLNDDELKANDFLAHNTSSEHSQSLWIDGETYLTPREIDILERLFHGRTNKEIATDLDLQECTIKNNFQRIFRKFNVNNRTEANIYYTSLRTGIMNPLRQPDSARKNFITSNLI